MHQTRELICQYLKGSNDGALCGVVDKLIRSMENADIRLCMNRHHEACLYYVSSLRRAVTEAEEPDIALGKR